MNLIGQSLSNKDIRFDSYIYDDKLDNINYNVPFIFQNKINMCVDSCLYMMLFFFRKIYTICDNTYLNDKLERCPNILNTYQFYSNKDTSYGGRVGKYFTSLKKNLENNFDFKVKHNFIIPSTRENIFKLLYNKGPFAIKMNSFHRVLAKGIINNKLIYHDPWRGRNLSVNYNDKSLNYTYIYSISNSINDYNISYDHLSLQQYLIYLVKEYIDLYEYQGKRGLMHIHSKNGVDRMKFFLNRISQDNIEDAMIISEIAKFIKKNDEYQAFHGNVRLHSHSGLTYILCALRHYFKYSINKSSQLLSDIDTSIKLIDPNIYNIDWNIEINNKIKAILIQR